MRIADTYAKFRGSVWFLAILCSTIAIWIGWNLCPFLPHFDDAGFGRLNLILSSEASISVALLIMAGDKREEVETRTLRYILHLLEGMSLLLEQQSKNEKRENTTN